MMLRLIILFGLFFFLGCATSYTTIKEQDTFAENSIENEDIKLDLGFQGFGKNNRFRDNFVDNKIAFLRLTITNRTNQPIIVDEENINLKLKDQDLTILPLGANSVAERTALSSAGYWFWGLLWFGYTKCENNDCESSWYPVGLLIGAINYFRATSTNSKMEDELMKNRFKGGTVMPGEKMMGYLFFDSSEKRYYDLQIKYHFEDEGNKEISIPYSF